ncbi:hypothetical protein HHSLTHF2_23820 [Vreelandella venusta]|uniref:Class I SAM-dependent methyltransferase n=1 Tax=Halomonas hydrothermalis TaxID=115561 RepID=A0A6F8U4U8_9GAMM|nr:class I SAM-dependent methyltransferase [Halomonas hydrothermalis]BCB08492.1 hypothetical protein HHSLTHF2_23820 [Halomonas hydrothermalis]
MDQNDKSDLAKQLETMFFKITNQQNKSLKSQFDEIYTQLESLSWLQRALAIQGALPPLRGWPVSPDFLLRVHNWIRKNKPRVIVETGSGASTLVIADALRQNGVGVLISLEHLKKYGDQTWQTLVDEHLTEWVDLRVGELVLWKNDHLNSKSTDKPSRWYPLDLNGINHIDLLIVDGPPGDTCQFARYPAVPALFDRLAVNAEVWMDDANREDEKAICKRWAELYDFDLEYISLEKGLARLTRLGMEPVQSFATSDFNSMHPEFSIGLDFTLPEERR